MGDAPAPASPFGGTDAVDFHTEPFADAAKLRASFGAYASALNPARRSEPAFLTRTEAVRALLLFGPSAHVIYPAFDEIATVVFPYHAGPPRLADCGPFVPWARTGALGSPLPR